MDQMVFLGTFECSIQVGDFIDNEFCHVFLHHQNHAFNRFKLQPEEVAGMMKAEFASFYDLWMGKKDEIRIEGMIINGDGGKVFVSQTVGRDHFTPNINSYYEKLVTRCRLFFNGGGMEFETK